MIVEKVRAILDSRLSTIVDQFPNESCPGEARCTRDGGNTGTGKHQATARK